MWHLVVLEQLDGHGLWHFLLWHVMIWVYHECSVGLGGGHLSVPAAAAAAAASS